MPSDISFLEFASSPEQESGADKVFNDYLLYIANKKLRRYKLIVHTRGEKQGQSYYSHVMDLVTIAEKLRPAIGLDEREMRCVLLALTIHDLNKVPPYDKGPGGREAKYADAATTCQRCHARAPVPVLWSSTGRTARTVHERHTQRAGGLFSRKVRRQCMHRSPVLYRRCELPVG